MTDLEGLQNGCGGRWKDYTMHPRGSEWWEWIGQVLKLKRCWNCRWNWIWRRDIFFTLDGECHACWLWSK